MSVPRWWRRDGLQLCAAPPLPVPPAVGEQAGGGALVRAAESPSYEGPCLIDFRPLAQGAQRCALLSPCPGTPSAADRDTRCHRLVACPGGDMDDTGHIRHDQGRGAAIVLGHGTLAWTPCDEVPDVLQMRCSTSYAVLTVSVWRGAYRS